MGRAQTQFERSQPMAILVSEICDEAPMAFHRNGITLSSSAELTVARRFWMRKKNVRPSAIFLRHPKKDPT